MERTEHVTAEDIALELLDPSSNTQEGERSRSIPVHTNPYIGIAAAPFSVEAAGILMQQIPDSDVEIRPDGLIYLPEIKYRRILNRAFGPGAWSLLPIDITVSSGDNMLYYRGALFVHGRFVSEAIGEQQYFATSDRLSYATAAESAKSNCLTRCCKDLGIASELWDPTFVRRWIATHALEVWCVNVGSNSPQRGKKKKMWRKKDAPAIDSYPWREDEVVQKKPLLPEEEQVAQEKIYRTPVIPEVPSQGSRVVQPPLITFRQAKRFRAIANEYGWSNDMTSRLLESQGYNEPESIGRSDYNRLCSALEDSEIRASFSSQQPVRHAKAA